MSVNENVFSEEKAEDSSGFLLWQVTSIWQREIRKVLVPFDLTHSQFVLLASIYWLSIHNEEVTQVLLSKHTKIDPMTTSTVLRTLQSKGLIQRAEHKTDTRAKTVILSQKGIELVKQAVISVEAFDKEFFKILQAQRKSFNQNMIDLLKVNEE